MPTLILKGESGHKSKKVDGSIVTCDHVTLNKVTDQHYQCRTVIDFTDVPMDRILELASETVLIQSRPAFKNAKAEELDQFDDWVIPVKDINKRSGKSKVEKAKELLAQLSPEEIEALLN